MLLGCGQPTTHSNTLEKQNEKNQNTYITRLLALLVLTVLHDLGVRAEHIDHFGATKLTGKVKRGFKALEHQDRRSVTDSEGHL